MPQSILSMKYLWYYVYNNVSDDVLLNDMFHHQSVVFSIVSYIGKNEVWNAEFSIDFSVDSTSRIEYQTDKVLWHYHDC